MAMFKKPVTRQEIDGIDAWDGAKLCYLNPATGGSPMPTMATFRQRLPADFDGKPYRQTEGAVFSVVEGSGMVTIECNEEVWTFEFGPVTIL